MKTIGVVLVAGKSTRFDSNVSKQVFLLKGQPVYSYSINAFEKSKCIDKLIVVTNEQHIDEISKFTSKMNKAKVVLGGLTRQESVEKAMNACECTSEDILVIHDGARPLIDEQIIKNVIEAAKEVGASTTYIPETDTIAKIDGENIGEFVDRRIVAKIQTPQAFKFKVLKEAHELAKNKEATDDTTLVKNMGAKVKLVLGNKKLTKLTTIEDIKYLEGLIK